MDRTLINELGNKIGQSVLLKGWVSEIRNLNKIKFIILADRSGDIQTVAIQNETDMESFDLINTITKESVVELIGNVKENKTSKWGIEVIIEKCVLLNKADTPLPIDNSDKSNTHLDKRLDFRFLDTRNKKINALFRLRGKIVVFCTEFFDNKGFTNIQTPKINTIGVESGSELFELDYFGKPAYLSQSPQIYKQMFVAGGFERVYEIAPVFRAENSNTTRHLTEFTGVDLEMGFIKDENDIMEIIEELFSYLIKRLKSECSGELKILSVELKEIETIPKITMKKAKEILLSNGKKLSEEDDLDSESEKILGEFAIQEYGSEFIFITNYPWAIRPFYHMKPENDEKGTKSFDLLYNGVEISTGAQREHRLEILKKQAEEKGIDFSKMKKYEEIFKFGMPPHGGVGFGLDRITHRLLKLGNVREAVLLPRAPDRNNP
ncbi:aspartate--tRNA(Asn) ligase [Candidatus Woesearchaeota archaeon]|nr:aspartate--tRNA(Asn) ligase [Candidatus Woesearchaeota archaeon]MCF7901143.1 aspartate--tRNA(Asn) ligase [Candidatus Woesearchaeota archaeon]MCF8013680.1 aspartate--tRNA(Asn) ligase [Candidatus Woesearchaeota archaeon]